MICDRVDRGSDEHIEVKITIMSHFQCLRGIVEHANKKQIVRPAQTRYLQIHFPIIFHKGFYRREIMLDESIAWLFHARQFTNYWTTFMNDGNIRSRAPDVYLMKLIRRLHNRMAKLYLEKSYLFHAGLNVTFEKEILSWIGKDHIDTIRPPRN